MSHIGFSLVMVLMISSLFDISHPLFSKTDSEQKEIISEVRADNFANEAVATFYVPGGRNNTGVLGTKDRKGNSLIGHRVEDVLTKLIELKAEGLSKRRALARLKDEDPYIGIAADHTHPKNTYGTMVAIDSETLTEKFKLKEIYEDLEFKELHARIVDTGGAFIGNGSLKIDIALASLDMAYAIGRVKLSLVYVG
ncbi:MAG: hypothetical protein EBR67_03670 [Proteobacteria bacterium]|nr:hypothetical protein [Pseudomonadota bacterium]